jgi:hypothetical protein
MGTAGTTFRYWARIDVSDFLLRELMEMFGLEKGVVIRDGCFASVETARV